MEDAPKAEAAHFGCHELPIRIPAANTSALPTTTS
jgi:hypothetical protein